MFIFILIIGACLGSFVTAISLRVSKEQKIFVRRSTCDNCGIQIKAQYLVPIFGYLFSGRKCRKCNQKISAKYTVYEMIHTILYISNYYLYNHESVLPLIILCAISSLLLMISIIDIETMYIYDIHIIILFILFTCFLYSIHALNITSQSLVYLAIPFIFKYVYEKIRWLVTKENMTVLGIGDAKLLGMIFFLLDFPRIVFIVLLSGLFGVIFGIVNCVSSGSYYAFVPSISIAVYLVTIYFYI